MKITGNWQSRQIWLDEKLLSPSASQWLRNHSPDGFNWGYGGGGPAQLALAILLELYGKEFAQQHYQDFKFEFVAALPQADFDLDYNFDGWKAKTETKGRKL